jgi:dolichyl-phosphate-mannose--protein O-mannosyl transferase
VLLIGFFGQWLPWALSPRSAFVYHFLPAVPFGAIAVAFVIVTLFRRGGVWHWVVFAYLAALVAYFVYFYPIHAAVPISREAFEARLWFPSWR